MMEEKLADLVTCFIPIHVRHLTVHENEIVGTPLALVDLFYIVADQIECFLSARGVLNNIVNFNTHIDPQYDLKSINIVYLIIHYQDLIHDAIRRVVFHLPQVFNILNCLGQMLCYCAILINLLELNVFGNQNFELFVDLWVPFED